MGDKKKLKVDAEGSKKMGEGITKGESDQAQITLVRSQSSVVIKYDGKDKKSYEIKAYADTAQEAAEIAKEVDKNLHKYLNKEEK